MDFTPDEAQRAAAELAAAALARTTGDAEAWSGLADAGLLALSVPESLGGDGLGVVELAAVVREAGRAGARVPVWAALALGLLPLVRLGGAERSPDLLRAAASGEALLTAALHEPSSPMVERPATGATATATSATATPDDAATENTATNGTVMNGTAMNGATPNGTVTNGTWRLDGTKTAVPLGAEADRILVPATLADGTVGVFLLDPSVPGVRVTPAPTASGMPEAVLRLDGAETGPPLGGPGGAADPGGRALRELHRHALAGAVAFGDGLLAGALALTTTHLATRQQFGRPLAAFQAVAQQAADVYVASRTVHLATESAAWRLDRVTDDATAADADSDLEVAAYWLAEQAPVAMATCHHLHGGVGVDRTYPLHRYSSLLKDLVRGIGGTSLRLDRVGALTGGAA